MTDFFIASSLTKIGIPPALHFATSSRQAHEYHHDVPFFHHTPYFDRIYVLPPGGQRTSAADASKMSLIFPLSTPENISTSPPPGGGVVVIVR